MPTEDEKLLKKKEADAELLRSVAEKIGKTPSMRDVGNKSRTILKRFKTWDNAIKYAGLPPKKAYEKYTKTDLIDMLRDLVDVKKMKPTFSNWQREKYPTMSVIKRLFGNWDIFVKESGYRPINDLTGLKFGRLTVDYRLPEAIKERSYWHCICECGNEINVMATYLTNGDTKSCGCLKLEINEINLREKYEDTRVDGVVTSLLSSKRRKDNKSKVKGVHIRKLKNGKKSYHAYISVRSKQTYLGAFKTLELAEEARKKAVREHHQPIFMKYKQKIGNTFTVEKGITSTPLLQGGWHYTAYYRTNGKTIYIGRYHTLERAIQEREAKLSALKENPNIALEKPKKKIGKSASVVKVEETNDEELFEEVRKLARQLGRRPSMDEFEKTREVLDKFGSWALFLQRARIKLK